MRGIETADDGKGPVGVGSDLEDALRGGRGLVLEGQADLLRDVDEPDRLLRIGGLDHEPEQAQGQRTEGERTEAEAALRKSSPGRVHRAAGAGVPTASTTPSAWSITISRSTPGTS